MRSVLVPVIPVSPARRAQCSHVLTGIVLSIERWPVPTPEGVVLAKVRLTVRVERVDRGPIGVGECVEIWGSTLLAGSGAVGLAETVPGSLSSGERVEAHLDEESDRLVLSFWLALTRLP